MFKMLKFRIYPNLHQNEDLTLSVWTCDCGATHNRELNVANNIKSFVLNMARIAQINTCGVHVSPEHSCAEAGTLKQEVAIL